MTAQHTPGPWECRPSMEYPWDYEIRTAVSEYRGDEPQEAEANARLIAAAPDLLEALKSVQAAIYMDDAGQLRLTRSFDESVIDAAIQKATQVGAHKEGD